MSWNQSEVFLFWKYLCSSITWDCEAQCFVFLLKKFSIFLLEIIGIKWINNDRGSNKRPIKRGKKRTRKSRKPRGMAPCICSARAIYTLPCPITFTYTKAAAHWAVKSRVKRHWTNLAIIGRTQPGAISGHRCTGTAPVPRGSTRKRTC